MVDLESLKTLTLSHDGRGHGAGVFVDRVVVVETEHKHLQHVFPCGRWLDTHEDDCCTQRTLRMIGTLVVRRRRLIKDEIKLVAFFII